MLTNIPKGTEPTNGRVRMWSQTLKISKPTLGNLVLKPLGNHGT